MSLHTAVQDQTTNSVQNNVSIIVPSFCVAWLALYILSCRTFKGQSAEYCVRTITVVHGIVTSCFGMKQCFNGGLFGSPLPMSNEQALLLAFSASYFIMDLSWCIVYRTETKLMLGHHVYSCISLIRIVCKGYAGSQSCCGLGCAEITNPLLQARWFIRCAGYHKTRLFLVVEGLFISTFFIVRILFGTIFTTVVITSTANNLEYKAISFIIYIISWLFMINIFKYIQTKHNSLSFSVDDVKPVNEN